MYVHTYVWCVCVYNLFFTCISQVWLTWRNTTATVELVSSDTTLEGCNYITGNQPIDLDALDLDHFTCPFLLNLTSLIFLPCALTSL